MRKRTKTGKYVYRFLCACINTLLATAGFAYVWFKFVEVNNQTGSLLGRGNLLMAISIYAILFIIICRWMNAFKIGVERKAKVIASVILGIITSNAIEILISMAITGQFRFAGEFAFIYLQLTILQAVVLTLTTILMTNVYRMVIPPSLLLEIVGKNNNRLTGKMNGIRYKYHIVETISYESPDLYEKLDQCESVLVNDVPAEIQNDIVKKCFEQDKRVYVVPKLSDIIMKASEDLNVVDTPLFLCKNLGIKPWQRFFKRVIDVVFSGLALIILGPVFLITSIAIKIEDHGPIFFKQERVTLNEKRFMIFKFRSMIVDAEKDGRPHPAGEKDDRITKVGRVIRSCRIDELPQLINILKGDMSLVGPRPERWEHVEKYTAEIPEFSFRHKVKGGLTGYAQVYGKYNTSALDKLKLDMEYITNYSLLLDFQIIFETVKILFQKESTEGFDDSSIKKMHDGQ